jgi:hypothetical protein
MRQEPIRMALRAVLGRLCPTTACAGLCRASSEHRQAWVESESTERVVQSTCTHKPDPLYAAVQPSTSRSSDW